MDAATGHKPFYVRLRREITWLLVIKLFALIVIYNSFFSSSHKAVITPQSLNHHLLNLSSEPSKRKSP